MRLATQGKRGEQLDPQSDACNGHPVFRSQRLETERLILRPPQAGDFEPWAAFIADEEAARHIGGTQARPVAWRQGLRQTSSAAVTNPCSATPILTCSPGNSGKALFTKKRRWRGVRVLATIPVPQSPLT